MKMAEDTKGGSLLRNAWKESTWNNKNTIQQDEYFVGTYKKKPEEHEIKWTLINWLQTKAECLWTQKIKTRSRWN